MSVLDHKVKESLSGSAHSVVVFAQAIRVDISGRPFSSWTDHQKKKRGQGANALRLS